MTKTKEKKERIMNIVRMVVAVLLIILFTFSLILGIFSGAKTDMVSKLPFAVLEVTSDSMYPKIKAGDGIIEVKTPYKNLKVNDIITIYQNGELVTHEIVSKDGAMVTTRGIANNYDDVPITAQSYSGKVAIILPGYSTFLDMTKGWKKIIWIIAIVFVLFGPEVIFKLTEERREKKRTAN